MEALVVGAGIGGLTAAIALARRGIAARVVELRPGRHVLGVGINQPGNALRVLDRLGLLEPCLAAGFAYDRTRYCDAAGNLVVEVRSGLATLGIPANSALSRPALHRILTDAAVAAGARIDLGVSVAARTETGDGVEVAFTDGSGGRYGVVAAFDGIRSPTRTDLLGSPGPAQTGYGVWRVTLPRPAEVTGAMLFQGEQGKAGVIPLSQREMYLLHVTPEPGGPRHRGAAPAGELRARLAEFGGLVGELRDALGPEHQIVYGPIEEVHLELPWSRGHTVVLGDAAHASAPHLTQGAAMAMEDALVLADLVGAARGAAVPETLAALARRRFPRTRLVQDVAHSILAAEMDRGPGRQRRLREHQATLPARMADLHALLRQPP